MRNVSRPYKQPRTINGVSITLGFLLAAGGYILFAAWPVIARNAAVKSVLDSELPQLHRANLLPEPESTLGAERVRQALIQKLEPLELPELESALTVTRNERIVAIAVKFAAAIDLKLIGKKFPVHLNPRVETSAARVAY